MAYYPVKTKYVIGSILACIVTSILFDHYFMRYKVEWYTRLFAIEDGHLSNDFGVREFSQLSFTTTILVPFIAVLIVIAVVAVRRKMGWSAFIQSVSELFWSLGLLILSVWIGNIVYLIISSIDLAPFKIITGFCDKYTIDGKVYLLNIYLFTIRPGVGVGALVGLVIGLYLYFDKGVLKVLIEKAGLKLW